MGKLEQQNRHEASSTVELNLHLLSPITSKLLYILGLETKLLPQIKSKFKNLLKISNFPFKSPTNYLE